MYDELQIIERATTYKSALENCQFLSQSDSSLVSVIIRKLSVIKRNVSHRILISGVAVHPYSRNVTVFSLAAIVN